MKKILGVPFVLVALAMLAMLVKSEVGMVMKMLDQGLTPFLALGGFLAFFFWITLFGAFLKVGLALIWPLRFSRAALACADLKDIYEAHVRGVVPDTLETPSEIPYETFTDQQLVSVFKNIQSELEPGRYGHLLFAIKSRIESCENPDTMKTKDLDPAVQA